MTIGYANQGYVLPAITAAVSPAARVMRTAAIAANPRSHEIYPRPRSVINQLELPCCVSTALGAAMEILHPAWPALAPLFHYYVTRYERGGADSKGFLELRSGLDTLTSEGICRYDLHRQPYTESGSKTRPKPEAYTDGAERALRWRQWHYVDGISRATAVKEQLDQGLPVVIGLQLPEAYPRSFLNPSYEWLDPNVPLKSDGGHCVLAFGYSDARRAIRIQDSQGEDRFDEGCWWMGYRIVDSPIVKEIYSLTH